MENPDSGQERKLSWFGQVARSSGLAKTIPQGTVNGDRRSRQEKRLKDNIEEWTRMNLASSTRQLKIEKCGKGLLQSHL